MTQHKVGNAGLRRIERLSSEPDHAGLNVTPPDPDQAGLNAKGLNEAINSRDVRRTPARHSHSCQRPKRSHDKCRYESLEEGFGGHRRKEYSC